MMTSLSMSNSLEPSQKGDKGIGNFQIRLAYVTLLCAVGFVWQLVAAGEFSAILTIAGMLQGFAVLLLVLQVTATGNTDGISVRALALEAGSLLCRLSSTTWLNGYLPVDASGDHIFQAVDMATVLGLLWLVHTVRTQRKSREEEFPDTCPVVGAVLGAFVLGALFHSDMNMRPVFDALWMIGLNLGVVAVLPQMWLLAKERRRIKALTSHYIAAMAFGRILSGIFMWHARDDITCQPWMGDFNHGVYAILGAHALHLIFLGDFVFLYVKAVITQGFNCQVELDLIVDAV